MAVFGNFDASGFIEKNRNTLNLKKRDIIWLKSLTKVENIFNSNHFVEFQIVKIYLKCLRAINRNLKKKNSSFEECIKLLENLALDRSIDYSKNKHFSLGGFVGNDIEKYIYRYIYARAECLVRDKWGIRIRVNSEHFSPIKEIQISFDSLLGELINEKICSLKYMIDEADDNTEMMLNQLDNKRWKKQLKQVSKRYASVRKLPSLLESIDRLAYLNMKNTQRYLLFYDAAAIIISGSEYDSLRFYLHYVNEARGRASVRRLNLAMRKILSFDLLRAEAFDRIIVTLNTEESIESALVMLEDLYGLPHSVD